MRRLGLIGGTGLDLWGTAARSHSIGGIYGQSSAAFSEFQFGELQVFFLPRHGERHEIPPHAVNYRANIDGFRQLQVNGVVAINAVGGITRQSQPGTLCAPDQLVDYTWGRQHTFSMTTTDKLVHTEFAHPFEGRVRSVLLSSAGVAQVDVVDGGCLAVSQGPRLETAAEIRRYKQDGCDLVGMTSMPEASLAREAGLDYASLCVNANWAAGVGKTPVSMQDIEVTLADAMISVRKLLGVFFKEFCDAG